MIIQNTGARKARIVGLLSTTILTVSSFASVASAHSLPLGDGNISTAPKQGYVYSCQTSFNPNAPGASASGAWLNEAEGTWDPDIKPIIDGSVSWPSEIAISVQGDQRVITGNGLPDHSTGTFPVSQSDDAYQYDRNPNNINAQNVLLKLDVTPSLAASPSCIPMGMIGFALSGAAIYNALDGAGRDAPAHEIQDACNGHPERSGEYHYHDYSDCLTDNKSGPNGHSDLVGYALDGFGIFGKFEAASVEVHSTDLDTCHGHVGKIEWDGANTEMYHYHFSEDYPYSLGCFAGETTNVQTGSAGNQNGNNDQLRPAARSASRQLQPGNQNAGSRGPGGRGAQIMQTVAEKLGVTVDALRQFAGSPPPDMRKIAQGLGIDIATVQTAFREAR